MQTCWGGGGGGQLSVTIRGDAGNLGCGFLAAFISEESPVATSLLILPFLENPLLQRCARGVFINRHIPLWIPERSSSSKAWLRCRYLS